MRVKTFKSLFWIIVVLLVLSLIANFIFIYPNKEKISKFKEDVFKLEISEDPLSTKGFEEVEISLKETTFFLKNNCKVIPMTVTLDQAYSIQQGLEGKVNFRPMSHDTIISTFENFNIEILMIKISRMEQGVYLADLLLKRDDKILNLDVRPSDAVALAVRTKTKVYVSDELLKKYGQKVC